MKNRKSTKKVIKYTSMYVSRKHTFLFVKIDKALKHFLQEYFCNYTVKVK